MHLFRYDIIYIVRGWLFHTQANRSKCPPSASINFLTRVTRELVNLRSTTALLMLLAALRIRWNSSSLVFTLCGPRRRKKYYESYGVNVNPKAQFQSVHLFAYSRCRMNCIWYGYSPSVCNFRQNLRVEVVTSGLNSRPNCELEMSNCIRTHGSELQC